MKKVIYLLVLLSQFFITQDVQVKISESSIQNLFNSLAHARYFSYGKADLGGVVTFYNFKATGMSLDIQPNNLFTGLPGSRTPSPVARQIYIISRLPFTQMAHSLSMAE